MEVNKHEYLIDVVDNKVNTELSTLITDLSQARVSSGLQYQPALSHFTEWRRNLNIEIDNSITLVESYITYLIKQVNIIKEHREALDELKKLEE